jgi:hypothetical protein
MNGHTIKIGGAKSTRCQQERNSVSADYTMGRAFDVGKVKRKTSKLADVLGRLQVVEC